MTDWHQELHIRRSKGIRLGLEPVQRVLEVLELLDPKVPVIQVLGTNGKGSTVAMLERGLLHCGARVGAFTSPHLHEIRERVRIAGRPVSDGALQAAAAVVLSAERSLGIELTFFEVLTCAAAKLLSEARVQYWVLEAGLGGRFDATSVFPVRLQLFTRIGLDHQAMLGPDLESIAAEKAAAIRCKAVYSVPQADAVHRVLADFAERGGTELRLVRATARPPHGLAGSHQRLNAGLALAALHELCEGTGAELAWLDGVSWPGRLESVIVGEGRIVLDVAHNLDAMEALRAHFAGDPPSLVILGARKDKDPQALAEILASLGAPTGLMILPDVPDSEQLLAAERRARVEASAGATVLVCGSHTLVAALRAQLLDIPASGQDARDLRDPSHRFFAGEGPGPLS